MKQRLAGVLQNTDITCSLMLHGEESVFWIINGSVYGLFQIPGDFVVCRIDSCKLDVLTIPVAQSEMDGITFQCVGIDYHNNTQYLGGVTVLEVIPLPQLWQLSMNS